MRCPRCQLPLRSVLLPASGAVQVHLCEKCEGAWYPLGSLTQVGRTTRESLNTSELSVSLVADQEVDVEAAARCPVCQEQMNRFTFPMAPEVKIDECLDHGTWLDDGELGSIIDSVSEAHRGLAELRDARQDPSGEPFVFTLKVLNTLLARR